MMMPLICSCDRHSFNLLACTKNWSKWSLTCLGHNPFDQSLDLKKEQSWIPISGQASSESWSLGILFSQSLDLERKKKSHEAFHNLWPYLKAKFHESPPPDAQVSCSPVLVLLYLRK
jgi:hypothetical protein